jgi:hypothetical protein
MNVQLQLAALLTGATDAGMEVHPVIAPDSATTPYIVYQRVSGNSENVLSGDSGLVNTRMQIDIYADTYGAAVTIARQIDVLMAAWILQNVSVLSQDGYEDAVKLFRITSDFSIWHPPT